MNRLLAISKRLIIEAIKQGIFMLRGRPADSVAISDTVETEAAFVREPADSVGMTATATTVTDFNPDAADSALFSDTVDTITDFNPLAADSVAISDTAVPVSTFDRVLAHDSAIADRGYVLMQDYAEDPTYFGDDYAVGMKVDFGYARALTDTVVISDTVTTASAFDRALSDAVGIADTVSTTSSYNAALADGVGIADTVSLVSEPVTSDTMSITDTGYMLIQTYALDPTYFADDYVVGTKQTFD